ncbi:alpha/beta fold hydrolase [Aneurinibacillus terranovensis]|uniref:alpha/beta fold hydrolase n=1 Tax=Aneurinibacillus terranovensis TaxID=278991 RepID=UPI00048290FD|nr:alpha/beta hydrolase [Aneurinibacillus terranovensis]
MSIIGNSIGGALALHIVHHGREDQVIPLQETSLKMAQLLPNVELHVFSQCGHWTQIEKTKEFSDQVIYFLSLRKVYVALQC